MALPDLGSRICYFIFPSSTTYSMSKPVETIVIAMLSLSSKVDLLSYVGRSILLKQVCALGYIQPAMLTPWIWKSRISPFPCRTEKPPDGTPLVPVTN
mmetsp:Transcript_11953/g.18152  ORF Transcript_11953/g.18152 Transcript_11953/m.18152 type:complete len:98 (-) Transcript_11953:382-675(-)